MEKLALNQTFWNNKRVLVTGHTGFKGGWLSMWLNKLGANVHGYALEPTSKNSLFNCVQLEADLAANCFADIRDSTELQNYLDFVDPEVVFHLAAQPIVRESYGNPKYTFEVNVNGTLNLLEALRKSSKTRSVINVTSDKCYQNEETDIAYRETDKLGGADPYSSSKACAELITEAYRRSFFDMSETRIATVRAGNVIGGGDWSKDRLIPDYLRSIETNTSLVVRNPDAIRPWQHVLEPIFGYLKLAELLSEKKYDFTGGWNFGPNDTDNVPVREVLEQLQKLLPGSKWELDKAENVHEAVLLRLDTAKAEEKLNWHPRWCLAKALEKTVDWHNSWISKKDMKLKSISQITEYENS